MTRAKRKLPRRDIDKTRKLLLEAGESLLDEYQELVDDKMLADALRHIRMKAVLERATFIESQRTGTKGAAQMTSGVVYHAFPGGEAQYRAQLLRHVLSADRTASQDVLLAEVASVAQENDGELPKDIPLLVRRLAAAQHVHDRQVSAVFTRVGFFAFAGHTEISELLAENYRETIDNRGIAAFYEVMLVHVDRQWKPPITTTLFANLVIALLEGLNLRWRVDHDAVPDDVEWKGEDWTLFAIGVEALVEHLTEPRITS